MDEKKKDRYREIIVGCQDGPSIGFLTLDEGYHHVVKETKFVVPPFKRLKKMCIGPVRTWIGQMINWRRFEIKRQ